jgi:hypothetical protein
VPSVYVYGNSCIINLWKRVEYIVLQYLSLDKEEVKCTIGLDFFLWDVAQPKSGPFNDLGMLKNTQIFAKSYNFEDSFSQLYVGYVWVQPEINFQCF